MTAIVGQRGMPASKIIVCVPMRDQVDGGWAYDYGALMAHSALALAPIPGASLESAFCYGTYLDSQRNDLAENALAGGAAALLWMDSDMRFPRDALLRLMLHREKFVGVNYGTRMLECRPTAVKRVGDGKDEGERCYSDAGKSGLEEVEAVGFGLTLIHSDVFRAIKPPWFEMYYDKRLGRVGEDVDFCRKARKGGFHVHVDHDLSKKIGHMGKFEFRHEHVAEYRRMQAAT